MEPKHEDDFYVNLAKSIVNMNDVHDHCTQTKKIYSKKIRRLNRIFIRSDYIVDKGRRLQRKKKLLSSLRRIVKGSIRFVLRHVGIKSDINHNT